MAVNTEKQIYDFLSQRRLAFVGVSRKKKDFSRILFKEFIDRKYEVIPVNPGASDIDGFPCYKKVGEIEPPVQGALLITSLNMTEQLVTECIEAGIPRIWIYGLMGSPSANKSAIEMCRKEGVSVISGHCPLMFFPAAGLVHRFHAALLKLLGRYPK
ncbi:MAG: CoA-binding protein [Candidatus Zixiibacteriota bacterium]|nr:MAG: CoA-binding protein [candidate division Zixibacteria bacterium]